MDLITFNRQRVIGVGCEDHGWLKPGVPARREADQFMGHRGEGSHTGASYKHYRTEFLSAASDAVAEKVTARNLFKVEVEQQPLPGSYTLNRDTSAIQALGGVDRASR